MSGKGSQAVQSRKLNINEGEGGDKGQGSGREVQDPSVINKMETLKSISCTEELDIIGITETWLDIAGKHFVPEMGTHFITEIG